VQFRAVNVLTSQTEPAANRALVAVDLNDLISGELADSAIHFRFSKATCVPAQSKIPYAAGLQHSDFFGS